MAKKRKTRQQKLAADHRHQDFSQRATHTISLDTSHYSSPQTTKPSSPPSQHDTHNEYKYVKHDLIKTTSITGAIVLVELVLFFLLRP